ncbi:DUF6321 domain-containing protein [Terriglobus aquaticus]|uniref:DUF6321 domain-containing protein n=1 Tax=Terriglobus aquaticus TaxID=940139 RepID=A0ABW9KIF4_9BACT|nr:DUF6321 domain-containing protein [Terriglobus aquaticus]
MATKQASKGAAKKTARKTAAKGAPQSMPKAGRNPKGGLTQVGRDFFAKRDGSHLKPGVTGKADTPEKMLRKGSFLVRTFTHPRGPMIDPKGEPTRLALSAHAWGEKVPKTISEAHTLAAKGHTLLSKYHAEQERNGAEKKSGTRTAAKSPGSTASRKQTRKAPAKKTAGSGTKRANKTAARRQTRSKSS